MNEDDLVHEFAHAWQASLARRPASEVIQPYVGNMALATNVFPRGNDPEADVAALLRATGATSALHACVEGFGGAKVVATMLPIGARSVIALGTNVECAAEIGRLRAAVVQYFEELERSWPNAGSTRPSTAEPRPR